MSKHWDGFLSYCRWHDIQRCGWRINDLDIVPWVSWVFCGSFLQLASFCLKRLTYKQMPLCSFFPGPLSVLVMDNACIHHGAGILELAECFSMNISIFIFILHRYHGLIIMYMIRYLNWIPSIIFTRPQSNRRSLFKGQGLFMTPPTSTIPARRWNDIWTDGDYKYCYRRRCRWIFCTYRLFLATWWRGKKKEV